LTLIDDVPAFTHTQEYDMSAFISTRSLFAGLAAMTLAAGPALAQSEGMERVEVRGRVVEATPRYDVKTACASIEEQLQSMLARTWYEEGRYGEVKVQLVMENGQIGSVQAKGVSNTVSRKVGIAVHRLQCETQAAAGAQIYRFSVDFVSPDAHPQGSSDTRTAARTFRING
jgi:hypothetical protein